MKILIALSFITILSIVEVKAQIKFSGQVVDHENQGLPGANVLLLNVQDSTLVKGGITDEKGRFLLGKVQIGSYLFSIRSIGFATQYKTIRLEEDLEMGRIKMKIIATELQELVVTADRPFFEQKIDRMVVNVQNSLTTAGGSALDVLERSPGVLVNRGTNSLSLNGKEGIIILINGKESRQSMSSILQLLNGTSVENIEKIELITNPPAKYQAEGNGGIINIQLVKRADLGTNGSIGINAGYGQGEKAGTSLNVNHRKGKVNVYGDFSFSRNHWLPSWYNYRRVAEEAEVMTIESTTYREPIKTIYNGRIGVDYQLTDKTLVGGFLTGFSDLWDMDARIEGSTFSSIQAPSFVEIDLVEKGRFKHLMGNFNISHQFASKSKINFDLDYLYYGDRNKTTYENFSAHTPDLPQGDGFRQTNKDTPINIWMGNLDFTHSFSDQLKLETGLKVTTSSLTNDVLVKDLYNGEMVVAPSFSENSRLDEKIGGVYASLNYSINKQTTANLGLRYEHSETNLHLQNKDNVVDLTYNKLFPTFFLSRKLAKETSVQLSYGRRITRPSFADLAPFFIFLDPSTFFYGNTSLTPAISDNIKLGLNYKQYLLSLEHTHENNAIQYYQPVLLGETNQQVFTTLNLNYKNTSSLVLSIPVEFTHWWSMHVNVLGVRSQLETQELENMALSYYRINMTKTFKLPADYSIELSGFYQSESLNGISRMGAYQNVNMGIQKKFSNDSKLRISFNNIFGYKINYYTDGGEGYFNEAEFRFERRIFNVSYLFNFGNEKLKSKRNRSTGSDDIRNRIK